jgi:hypothetical protein
MGVTFGYVAETPEGFMLTDLGRREALERRRLFGLDDKINLAGRLATGREQHQQGNTYTIRGDSGPRMGKEPFGHWAVVIQKDTSSTEQFGISLADFKYLRGEI